MDRPIEEMISECHHVFQMTTTPGWQAMRKVIDQTLETYSQIWMTMNKNRPEFDELRIEALACKKMIDLVESFDTQRKKLEEHWLKVNNPQFEVAMDMDNETASKGE
jgi:hypothetical protein